MVATLSTMEHAVVVGGEVSGPKKDNVAIRSLGVAIMGTSTKNRGFQLGKPSINEDSMGESTMNWWLNEHALQPLSEVRRSCCSVTWFLVEWHVSFHERLADDINRDSHHTLWPKIFSINPCLSRIIWSYTIQTYAMIWQYIGMITIHKLGTPFYYQQKGTTCRVLNTAQVVDTGFIADIWN